MISYSESKEVEINRITVDVMSKNLFFHSFQIKKLEIEKQDRWYHY